MDFWSRLLSHNPLSSGTSRKDAAKDPAKRLHRFEREYGQLLQIWRNSSNLSRDFEAAERLEIRLHELTTILTDESRRPLPHPCIQFASIKQIYAPVAKIATTSYNEWIIREAVLFFATLVESEEEAFVENPSFSASLANLLVRITGLNSVRLARDTEVRVVELAFNITTKIRLQSHILDVWFRPGGEGPPEKHMDDRERFAGRTQKADFPLFYILMDYIQHEGRVGDFARTGLLYIIEAASSSVALEQWIVESDLSTLMATGLGALYSQLSRKLVIDHPPGELPPVLALSDYQHPAPSFEVVASCSSEFQAHLETFLSHLLFWQDVLNHCKSVDVKSTLLEHFQVIFLQQLLYPSLLESSDIDGGSSVAVITYLRRILESLDHPDMINLILHYLLALPDPATQAPAAVPPALSTSVSDARKRKSLDLATMLAMSQSAEDLSVTPLLFNLVDLTLACLRSHSSQTIHVTLQLVSAILQRHHRYAIHTLLRTDPLPEDKHRRTAGAHDQEVEFLMSLAGSIGGADNFDEVYESILRDAMTRLESHPCSLKLVAPKISVNNHDLPAVPDSLPGAPPDVRRHTLRTDDPLLTALLDILETFFVNPVDTNLSVTETLTDLSVCGYMGVEGWLLRHPSTYTYEDDGELEATPIPVLEGDPQSPESLEKQHLHSRALCRRRPKWSADSLPRLLQILHSLSEQLAAYRESIPRFDDLLQQRREAFQTADSPPPPAPPLPPRKQTGTPERREASRSASPKPSALEGFAQRILSELGTPSRSGTPRGRREKVVPAGLSGGYGLGTPVTPPSKAPKEFPMHGESPSRSARGYSPHGEVPGSRDGLVECQRAAFAAIDQSILARRVGIPSMGTGLTPALLKVPPKDDGDASGANDEGGDGEGDDAGTLTPMEDKSVSVSHVLTNALILQSFLMEVAGLVQVRAGLFNEVRFV